MLVHLKYDTFEFMKDSIITIDIETFRERNTDYVKKATIIYSINKDILGKLVTIPPYMPVKNLKSYLQAQNMDAHIIIGDESRLN
jgi:hypothetical protein